MDFTELLATIADRPAMTPQQERAYLFANEIVPQLKRWGFLDRFSEALDMPERQRRTYERMRGLIRGPSAIVALVGVRGVGKTSMTAQLAIEYAWRNYRSKMQEVGTPALQTAFVYFKASPLVARFKSLYSDYGSVETERLLLAFDYIAKEHEIIVIDELHECDDQKMMRRVVTDLIDRRYAGLRHSIMISNQEPDAFALSAGDSIISRLNERGAILECSWESFR